MPISAVSRFETSVSGEDMQVSGPDFRTAIEKAGGDGKPDNLLQQLVSSLRPQGGNLFPGGGDPFGKGGPEDDGKSPTAKDNEQLLERVISGLNKELESGKLDRQQTALADKLLPMLEHKFVANGQSGDQTNNETSLLKQLVSELGQGRHEEPFSHNQLGFDGKDPTNSRDPSEGIGPGQIKRMIADANH